MSHYFLLNMLLYLDSFTTAFTLYSLVFSFTQWSMSLHFLFFKSVSYLLCASLSPTLSSLSPLHIHNFITNAIISFVYKQDLEHALCHSLVLSPLVSIRCTTTVTAIRVIPIIIDKVMTMTIPLSLNVVLLLFGEGCSVCEATDILF